MAAKRRTSEPAIPPAPVEPTSISALDHVAEALQNLKFGQVTILVHDGIIVQIERTEKKRLN